MTEHLSHRLAALPAIATLAACTGKAPPPPPQETWQIVTVDASPLLGELEDDDPAQEVIHTGELVKVVRELGPFKWDSKMDGVDSHREGTAVELKYAAEGASLFGFLPDFNATVSVPTTAFLCGAIAAHGGFDASHCPSQLRRAKTSDGALLIYMACSQGPCPVGLVRDGKLTAIAVEGLSAASFFTGKKRSMLVAHARWSKDDGKQSGGSIVPILLGGAAPERGEEIPVDRVDARDPAKVTARLAHARVAAAEVIIKGEETVKSADGATLSTSPVDEKRALPSLD